MANAVVDLASFFNINMENQRDYVFNDIAYLSEGDVKNLRTNYDIYAIRGAIRNLIEFIPGQRPLDPMFGNPLYRYVYENINDSLRGRVENEIRTYLTAYEPRISIENVTVESNSNMIDRNEYTINVYYTIPSLNTTDNLVIEV